MAKLKITNTSTDGIIHDRYTALYQINSAYVGGTGGNTTQAGRQISPTVKIGSGTAAAGSILFQKGAHKFRITDNTGNVATATLVNLATPTASNTMSIAITLNSIGFANIIAANVVGGATSTYVTYATANITGPATVGINSVLLGLGANTAGLVTAVNPTVAGLANVTIALTGNVAATTVTYANNTAYASRITNRYVYDYGSDGYLSTNVTSAGYNPTKWRYHLAIPDSTYVTVAYA
jgi:hypothetical protein